MIATLTAPFLLAASTLTFTADRIAADGETRAAAATGHVVAVSAPYTLRGESLSRDADGTLHFDDPTYATTCTNAVGHTHWNVTGALEYKADGHVILRNAWLKLYEIPVLWLPYLYYPLDWDNGFSWMPGYTGRWGGYLLTKYAYHLLGDENGGDSTWWLDGATRFDLRYRQGVAVGEDLTWNLGDFGRGGFNVYYAWDRDVEEYDGLSPAAYGDSRHSYNWESPVKRDRYSLNLWHRWEVTERDIVRLRATYLSDSSFRSDFQRAALFNWRSQWFGYDNSGVFWEHLEGAWSFGAEVSGRLNEFYAMTGRLPEFYLDVNPQPLFGLPANYESASRFGFLSRDPASFGAGDPTSVYSSSPGRWSAYEAFRFDTYHRLTAPFRTLGDVLSVVPRLGYRGTYWSKTGLDNLTGWGGADTAGASFRSILEGGVTFAARGEAWVNETWRHRVEPYFDVLAQKAWFSSGSSKRPFFFDNLDGSMMWEDQFAGRGRNLPYTYYGVTPGLRNAWDRADERGVLRSVVDLDAYAALQFGTTSFTAGDDNHRLAKVGEPNYGRHGCLVVPGARLRWTPTEKTSLFARAEYETDGNRIASADVGMNQVLSDDFSYYVKYALRDFRCWDFSSSPYDPLQMTEDAFNGAHLQFAEVGFEQHPIDWFAWGPFVRWDLRENELDCVGSWFDYLTDCLGFRFLVEYQNSFTRVDGREYEEDWSVGFYIYLRAFGSGNGTFFGSY